MIAAVLGARTLAPCTTLSPWLVPLSRSFHFPMSTFCEPRFATSIHSRPVSLPGASYITSDILTCASAIEGRRLAIAKIVAVFVVLFFLSGVFINGKHTLEFLGWQTGRLVGLGLGCHGVERRL